MSELLAVLNVHWVLIITCGGLGLLVGSFLNVVVHRLPKMMEHEWACECAELRGDPPPTQKENFNLAHPRSRCPHCGNQIGAFDNIPILSYLFLRGKCRHCKARISPRYPLVEMSAGLLAAGCAWHYAAPPVTTVDLMFVLALAIYAWALLALALIDFDTMLLPDSITVPLMWGGIVASLTGLSSLPLSSSVIGAIAGYLSLWSVYWLFKLVTGKEGMGHGDFKLLAAIGAWFGWQLLPAIILISSAIGAVLGITMMVLGRTERSQPIPFGPYLALAGITALFARDSLLGFFTRGQLL